MDGKIEHPNIILIVMDAVRADHLSCYGYHRRTSPNIDRLATQGVLFENAFSAAEWSCPSHASIFTGKYPSHHRTLGKYTSLHEESITIAEILSRIGYETFGISSNIVLGSITGFNKGFEGYVVLDVPSEIRSVFNYIKQSPKDFIRYLIYGPDKCTYRNIEMIKSLVKKRIKKKPFFLFTNLFNCHAPYDPPRPFKRRFCSSLNRSAFYIMASLAKRIIGQAGEKIRDSSLNVRKLDLIASEYGQFLFMAKELQVREEEWEVVKSWYDGGISYLDYRLGELISFLQREGIFENTFLIITSDHGENLGEHGLASHQFCLYDSLLHVPLIMVYPGVIPRERRNSSLVSTIDIFPTILEVSNIKGYQDDIQGRSLFPFRDRKIHDFICAECGESLRKNQPWSKGPNDNFQPLHPKLEAIDKGSKCLRTDSFKYILSADGKEELYDVKKDPFEEVNIAGKYPDKVKRFKKQLENTIDTSSFGPREFPAKKDRKEILKRLKKLGYI